MSKHVTKTGLNKGKVTLYGCESCGSSSKHGQRRKTHRCMEGRIEALCGCTPWLSHGAEASNSMTATNGATGRHEGLDPEARGCPEQLAWLGEGGGMCH